MIPTIFRTNGNGHHDYPDYTDWTLRKAIVNAVVHRDYEVQSPHIIIRLLPDHIELRNPRGSDPILSSRVCQSHSEE